MEQTGRELAVAVAVVVVVIEDLAELEFLWDAGNVGGRGLEASMYRPEACLHGSDTRCSNNECDLNIFTSNSNSSSTNTHNKPIS